MNDLTKLTPKQVAMYEVVHVNTVLNWISTGQLKAVKHGYRTYRINMDDYLEFAKKDLNER
jgi:excisionase family DNA binding protein|tara:strand:- start:551 stop:733 length:183 start_codon:yes stop_codon:yes gene_type:complete